MPTFKVGTQYFPKSLSRAENNADVCSVLINSRIKKAKHNIMGFMQAKRRWQKPLELGTGPVF
jgi:hypothetical protein